MDDLPQSPTDEKPKDASDECIAKLMAFQQTNEFHILAWLSVFVIIGLMFVVRSIDANIVLSIIWWTVFYLALAAVADKYIPNKTSYWDGSCDYTLGSYSISIFHQAVVCGAFLVYLSIKHGIFASDSDRPLTDWWYDPWGEWAYTAERQALICIFGYELKDFFRMKLDPGFLAHHICTFVGIAMCLVIPGAVGLVVMNGLIAEVGSCFFNASELLSFCDLDGGWLTFGKAVDIIYLFLMPASNVIACYIGSQVWLCDIALGWRVFYLILVVFLVLLRTAGQMIYFHKLWCAKATTPEQTQDKVNTVLTDIPPNQKESTPQCYQQDV